MSYRQDGEEGTRAAVSANEPLSLIDRFSSIEGTFTTSRDVRVEGVLRGKIQCQGLLYIAEGADIDADVEAASLTVAGKLSGNVTCGGKLQITQTGKVSATVTTETLVIDEGAVFEGDLTMKAIAPGSGAGTAASVETSATSVFRRFSGDEEDEHR
jgi:cytoskeletal protein CcmA (bactofilin family)